MKQSRQMSLYESCTNTAVGFFGAVVLQMIVFPMFGLPARWSDAFGIAAIYTVWSVIRGYGVRRIFEQIRVRSLIT